MGYQQNDEIIKNMIETSKEVEQNNRILKALFPNKEEVKETMKKGISTRTLAITGGVIAGVAFLAGKKEGLRIGFEKSKELHKHMGYTKAINDIINTVKEK